MKYCNNLAKEHIDKQINGFELMRTRCRCGATSLLLPPSVANTTLRIVIWCAVI
jgi:hypothetical protein